MASNSNSFKAKFYSNVMPKIYGIGAAVVILGAMFKILDWQFANIMIGVGLTTEAIIFFLSSFEPKQEEMDWSKIYPELADGTSKKSKGDDISAKLDDMLSKAKIGPELIESLGKGMQNLATSAEKMGNLSDAAVATNEYAINVKSAAKTLVDMNASYGKTAAALTEMSAASQDAKAYHAQIVNVTKNLTALNSVYEMELQDANSHVKTLNKFYSNMTAAMQGLTEAGKETEAFKNELAKLNQNVSSLNKIYGGMLSAMKG
ncbi:type IX secretion system motor protein PorL/GldL [Algoriphagus boritolerans]|uniref:Gliding motility-associated protein GldL n=1 Tax=Algoriphagus boritolerans DSM 17298 = JCM 18970 TaxID=1120964 RepID=A0A1H5W1P0_9BACT|nr:gliding motility protein GldL [Algoriphagus boritolerans]SEF93198.1 gliding motility-associated protein GldL [Algoriphagus boritolerans DSM 17298 = JCM 18970]